MSFRAYLDNIEANTGKTVRFQKAGRSERIRGGRHDEGGVNAGQIVQWLKDDFDLTASGVPVSLFAGLLPQSAERQLPALSSSTTMHRTQHIHRGRLAQLVRRLAAQAAKPELDAASTAARAAEDELLYCTSPGRRNCGA